jgi:Tfp pilus assembly protein PilO
MKKETKRLASLIIAALLIAGALVVYFEFIVPAYSNLQMVKGQEESEATLYANEQQIVSQAKSLLATYTADASSSQSVAMALPVGQDLSGALAQVYGIAANTGVTVQGTGVSVQVIAPQVDIASTTVITNATDSQIANAAAAGLITKPIGTVSFVVTGSGSYESFKKFLQGLETNIRIFNVTAISLQPVGATATKTQAANQDLFNYTITVVTYYQGS